MPPREQEEWHGVTCETCGSPNPVGRKFCGQCGTRLAMACTACGLPLDAGQRFCGECGTSVPPGLGDVAPSAGQVPGVSAPSGAVAERRLVSVLFADLVGFTPFSEERDSEEVRETLTRYFAIATDVISTHGGTVEKFIGDAVMAVWGTPVAREDDAERAVRAALELLDAIKGLGMGISARAGVLTGEAAVTLGATNQGMVAGDIVNTAARLQSVATPGTVLVGEATYRAASAAIAFEEAGVHTLKGKDEPVATWRALRVVAERGGRGRQELLEPPFVGRDEELRQLKDAFHATGREGRARLVSVTGPAGIGKSRLAWEFEKYLDGVVETVWWHHGRSPSYGSGIAFWALGEMVRARCTLTERDDEGTTRAHVNAMLEDHVPDPAERAWIEPAILALLGVQAAPVAADELFARWRLLFERLAATGTVALVFEDLHWADPGTLDFIDHLLDWSKSFPILVVTLARPELIGLRPDWGAGRRSFIALALDPLPEHAMRALLAGLVPALPEDAARRVIERAEGVPLYAVETVRMLLAEKRLEQRGAAYVPIGDISAIAVPETLTALIAARLDTLDPAARTLVLDASVLGQRFSLTALAAVTGVEETVLAPRLRALVRQELLTLEADPRSPERGQYGFVQALIREVAYHTLARRDRKDRHLAAARHFEQLGSEELAGALAGHFLAAYELAAAGPEADALAAQARVSLTAAIDRALVLGSYSQAIELIRQAIVVSPDPADQAAFDERLGSALTTDAQYPAAREAFERALAHQRSTGDRLAQVRVTTALGDSALMAKRSKEALELLRTALAEHADLGTTPEMTALRAQLSRAYYFEGEYDAAIPMADEVLDVAEPEGMLSIVADTLITKGTVLGFRGRAREGVALIEAGLNLASAEGLASAQLRALTNLGVLLQEIDPPSALRYNVEGLELARRIGGQTWVRNFVGNVGNAALRSGEWDLAERELATAIEERFEGADLGLSLGNLVTLRAARGEPVDDLLAGFQGLAAQLDPLLFLAWDTDVRSFAALASGRFSEAADILAPAVEPMDDLAPQVRVQHARFLLWAGRADEAHEELARLTAPALRYPTLQAAIASIRAGVGHLRGEGTSPQVVADARRVLVELGVPTDAAYVAIDGAAGFGPDEPSVRAGLEEARAYFVSQRAAALLALVDGMLEGRPGGVATGVSSRAALEAASETAPA